MDDAYSTQLTAGESVEATGLEQLMALKEGDTFLVADGWGDMKGGADGLFAGDTRVLSRWAMTVGLLKPSRLSSGVSQDNVFFSCQPPTGHKILRGKSTCLAGSAGYQSCRDAAQPAQQGPLMITIFFFLCTMYTNVI